MPVPGPPGDRLPPHPVGRGPWRLTRRRAPGWRALPPCLGRPPGSTMPPVACLALLGHGAACCPARRRRTQQQAPTPHRRPPPSHGAGQGATRPCRDRAPGGGAATPAAGMRRGASTSVLPPPAPSHTAARAWGHYDGPAHLRVPEPLPPARTGSAVGIGDRPTTAADRA
jgi:hypothetical protein